MKKIVLFIDSLGAGGAQRQLVGLAAMLKERNFVITVLYYLDNHFFKEYLDKQGVNSICIKGDESRIQRFYYTKKTIDSINPDIVISYLEIPSMICCILKMMGRKWELIVSERNTTQKNNCFEWLRFHLFKTADFVVPNSFSQQFFINNHYPFLNCKLKTITNYVDLDYFKKEVIMDNRIRKNNILVVASVWPPKNTIGFIKVVKILVEKKMSFHINWYGVTNHESDYYKECISLINKLEIEEYIELHDKTSDIKNKYLDADFFCLPSFFEGTPNVICEAISCGLPVACSDVCDNGLYVKNGNNGFLFDPKSEKETVDGLIRLLNLSQEEYNSFSYESRRIAEELLSKERFVQEYLDIIYN